MDTDDCAHALLQGLLRLGSRLRHERPPGALSANKIIVLGHLRRNGPCTPSAVALAEHQQLQALTRTFGELEADGLITRERSEADRRASILSIADAGAQALSDDLAQRAEWLGSALGVLSPVEQQLLVLAAQLLNQLADAPAAAGPGRRSA
ncbi:MarR family transcriptional regulator [Streptomyces sp. FXJ1.172]|uniref:MarR family winged helix-turn-helix transcriptional regulator n=1 Tax=Streptomyces sp. FXJ1.172 TaxID=710705 RepID=UPI0007D02143|nr:MarR family transcriptional regulator [Streptomyces sp. FXJ1.172]WEO93651.1 MarR family transcriptional regulator [Streptomyces sp. FXJ1.172]